MRRQTSVERFVLVFDTSVIVSLHELRCADLLDALSRLPNVEMVLPDTVVDELSKAGRDFHLSSGSFRILPATVGALPDDIPRRLGRGEQGAIAIAYEIMQHTGVVVVAVTDDGPARNKCMRLGIRVHGTLGLIELAKKWGVITKEQALQILDKVPTTGLHLEPDVLANAREKIRRQ